MPCRQLLSAHMGTEDFKQLSLVDEADQVALSGILCNTAEYACLG